MENLALVNPVFLAILIGLVGLLSVYYYKNRIALLPVIAGDVNKEYPTTPTKYYLPLNHFITGKKMISSNGFDDICYLTGDSLEAFGLPNNSKVLVKKIDKDNISRGDILVLEAEAQPNEGKLKGRVCLGFWGDPNESDEDLIKYEDFHGTVREYFEEVSPKKYGYKKPYKKQISNYLKTLSCDMKTRGYLKVSRPHDPTLIRGKIDYLIEN